MKRSLPPFDRVACIGAMSLDRFGETVERRASLHTSNIGRMRQSVGGAARNVAEALARLGVATRLISAIGLDADGEAALAATAGAGVDTAACLRLEGRRTASYTAIFDGEGELVIGLSDMAIVEALAPPELLRAVGPRRAGELVFADANLHPEAIAALLAQKTGPVAVGAVSAQKALRLCDHLAAIDLLFLNRLEAEAITARSGDLRILAGHLRSAGAERGVLSAGREGALAWQGDETVALAPLPASLVNVNGAGDALAAATLARLSAGDDLVLAARTAMAASALAVEAAETVRQDLSMDLVLARAGRSSR
jgi:pseudouridine kinase